MTKVHSIKNSNEFVELPEFVMLEAIYDADGNESWGEPIACFSIDVVLDIPEHHSTLTRVNKLAEEIAKFRKANNV